MKVVFRVDASKWIGTGHVMRCISLADMLRQSGNDVFFACLPQDGDMRMAIEKRGYVLYSLCAPSVLKQPIHDADYSRWLLRSSSEDAKDFIAKVKNADMVITDHYAIDADWQKTVKAIFGCKIVAIDDLVRVHYADLIIDQTLNRSSLEYKSGTKVLAGTDYALLASHFAAKHESGLDRSTCLVPPRVIIYMGGVDAPNATFAVLNSLIGNFSATYTVLLSPNSPHYWAIKNWCDDLDGVDHLDFVDDMASLMLEHDIAIGAAGTTSWERACVGLPSITIPIAENQILSCQQLELNNASISINMASINSELLPAIKKLTKNWESYYKANLAICDGRGASRVLLEIEHILKREECLNIELVSATAEDTSLVYNWQSLPETRKHALNSAIPSWEEHENWMNNKLSEVEDYFYIIKERPTGSPCGILRLDRQSSHNYLVSILVDPDYHGKGIGVSALSIADRIFPDFTLHAVVLEANIASQKLFEKAGYKKISSEKFIRKPII